MIMLTTSSSSFKPHPNSPLLCYANSLQGTIHISYPRKKTLNVTPLTSTDTAPLARFFPENNRTSWFRNADYLVDLHQEGIPWSCYLIRNNQAIKGWISLESSPFSLGNLEFCFEFFPSKQDRKNLEEKAQLFVIATWKWVAKQLLPAMCNRKIQIPIFNQGEIERYVSLNQATVQIVFHENPISKGMEAFIESEGFTFKDPQYPRCYSKPIRQILDEQVNLLPDVAEANSSESSTEEELSSDEEHSSAGRRRSSIASSEEPVSLSSRKKKEHCTIL